MRLLHVAARRSRGEGLERLFAELVAALTQPDSAGEVVQRAVLPIADRRAAALAAADVAAMQLPFGRWSGFGDRRALEWEIERFEPNVILAWDPRAARIFSGEARGIPIAGVPGDYGVGEDWDACDDLLLPTGDLDAYFAERGRLAVHRHQVPLFLSDTPFEAPSRAALEFDENAPLVFVPPLPSSDRGIDTVVRALAQLPGVQVATIARRGRRKALRRLARDTGVEARVRILDGSAAPGRLMRLADLAIVVGAEDSLGLAVIEAWRLACPVVGAGGLGPAALIRHERDGLLTASNDSLALARAIGRVLDDPLLHDRLADGGRKAYEANHTPGRAIGVWCATLRAIAGQPPPEAIDPLDLGGGAESRTDITV
jgi:glycosyltransferase involved in cell wall biosynthesis